MDAGQHLQSKHFQSSFLPMSPGQADEATEVEGHVYWWQFNYLRVGEDAVSSAGTARLYQQIRRKDLHYDEQGRFGSVGSETAPASKVLEELAEGNGPCS